MPVMSDAWIIKMSKEQRMIEPFVESRVYRDVISYGVSSYGYDVRIADEFKIYAGSNNDVIDPKKFNRSVFKDFKGDVCILPPCSFILARTFEYFRIPRNVLTICVGKSTYARCGIIINVTPFEPEWEGFATLAISNTSNSSVKIYANEGIAQLVFLKAETECNISYKDKNGKYQGQSGITIPKVD
ncbi:MAG: dCTP deaminase [Candidatus Zixiibacteriota bacterium]|nr:MAG: dCTP deaminase [candidate division Zixibacteria bacterium]